jgi:hypothetical protein
MRDTAIRPTPLITREELYQTAWRLTRHARACRGHPRLKKLREFKDVDGRGKPGHDGGDALTTKQFGIMRHNLG